MIISDPAQDDLHLVVTFFLSYQPRYDQACVLHGGEHPFVKHPTCVNYPGARLVSDARLEQMKAAGELKSKEPLSPELPGLIRRSAENADLPTECYEVLRRQGFVP